MYVEDALFFTCLTSLFVQKKCVITVWVYMDVLALVLHKNNKISSQKVKYLPNLNAIS
jgi:hypothetical protein